jgi:hypothetical protein
MFLAALVLGACALRSAPGVDADARDLADAVMEKLHPHHKELDAEIEKGLEEMAVNEPASWTGKDVVQMQTQAQPPVQAPVPIDTALAATEIASAVVDQMHGGRKAKEAQESIDKGLDEIEVNEPASWRTSGPASILSQIPDEPDAAKKVYYTLSGEPLPGETNTTASQGTPRTPNPNSAQGPWGEQIGCPHCGDTTGNCDCDEHDHAKPAEQTSEPPAAQPATALLRSTDSTSKQPVPCPICGDATGHCDCLGHAHAKPSEQKSEQLVPCPICGDTTGHCDCDGHAHAKPSEQTSQPATAFLQPKQATGK